MKPYFQDGDIRIYHGDCRDVMQHLHPVDLVLTDPPYAVNLGDHGGAHDGRTSHVLVKGGYLSYDDTLENLRLVVVPAVRVAIGMTRRAIVFCAGQHIGEFPKPNVVGGIYFPAAQGRNQWGFASLAAALMYGPGCRVELGSRATVFSSVAASEKNGHPCPKPINAMKYFINLGSEPGNTVLDPFVGSGTTLVAAKQLGRSAIGIEIEERYCEIAAKRLSQGVLELKEVGA